MQQLTFRGSADRCLNPVLAASLLLSACSLSPFDPAAPSPPREPSQRPTTIEEFMTPSGITRVIAHRGFSGQAPENTLVALRMAIEIGADMAEIDVGLSRDGHVMVLHDATLERTTDGSGLLADATLNDLRRLDAGRWFDRRFAGEPVPTLAEALDVVKGKILLNIEIKTEAVTETAEGGIVEKVLELVDARRMLDQIVISSFDPRALAQARQLDAEVRTASLYNRELHRGQGPLEVMAAVGSNGFNTSQKLISEHIVATCHRHRRPVAVYTVNTEEKMRQLIDLGVDALFTDHPDRLKRVLAETPSRRAAAL